MARKIQLTSAGVLARLRADRNWRGIAAVQQGRVVVLDDDLLA